jgi:hypothetical protein
MHAPWVEMRKGGRRKGGGSAKKGRAAQPAAQKAEPQQSKESDHAAAKEEGGGLFADIKEGDEEISNADMFDMIIRNVSAGALSWVALDYCDFFFASPFILCLTLQYISGAAEVRVLAWQKTAKGGAATLARWVGAMVHVLFFAAVWATMYVGVYFVYHIFFRMPWAEDAWTL